MRASDSARIGWLVPPLRKSVGRTVSRAISPAAASCTTLFADARGRSGECGEREVLGRRPGANLTCGLGRRVFYNSYMKIVTLNTWSGILHAQLLSFFRNYREVDIFCLQEIYHNAQGKLRPDETGEYALDLYSEIASILDTHRGFFSPLLGEYYGLAIFITKKLQLIEEGAILVHESRSTSHIAEHSRKLQYLRFEYVDRQFLLGNVHGLWNGKGKGDSDERIRQSERITDFLTSYHGSKILCGDLNLAPDTESMRILEQNMRNLIAEHRVDTTRTSHYSKEERFADYILVSPDISVIRFDVLPEQVSDHSALYLEVS